MPISRADRLAQIRALRAAGKTGFDSYEVEEAESIYETVDDDAYKKVVRSRLDQDDFVVDDNGEGYVENGREDWQDQRVEYDESEDEDDLPKNSKAGGSLPSTLDLILEMLTMLQPSGNGKKMQNGRRSSKRASTNTSARTRHPRQPSPNP